MGSDRPIRRLIAYYLVLGLAIFLLVRFIPSADRLLLGKGLAEAAITPESGTILQDGLSGAPAADATLGTTTLASLAGTTALILLGTLVLMMPVTWVYMSARNTPGHSQAVVQTLMILPLVVAGIVLIVRDSLALAFSLAGVVAAVRFRTNFKDSRDVVYVFLAVAVGFAAGVQTLAVGAVLTIIFNFLLLLTWRYDYGRNVLTPTAASRWEEPLSALATQSDLHGVPDRDLVLSLTPEKAQTLAERFERVSDVLGGNKKKPRYSAVLSVTSDRVAEAQFSELRRKVCGRRHARSSHQDRNHRDLTFQRGADLVANEIVARLHTLLDGLEPLRTDHDDHAIARRYRVLDRCHEILARLNVLNVHEHLIAAEAGGQAIAEPPGVAAGVSAPVADEDAGHGVRGALSLKPRAVTGGGR